MGRKQPPELKGGLCECGHSWWEHHWNSKYTAADMCMTCCCSLFSKAGGSCYWLVRLYYDLEYPHTHNAIPAIESWIGDEIRYERQQRTRAKVQREPSGNPADEAGE